MNPNQQLIENPTPEQAMKLWAACVAWVKSAKPICPESIYQTDSVILTFHELADVVTENVGFFPSEDDDDV
jgi:hypothetical protein